MICAHGPQPSIFQCTECEKQFKHKFSLAQHAKKQHPTPDQSDDEGFPCHWEQCGKILSSKSNLTKHIRAVHLNERPHLCMECGKGFANRSLLDRHSQIHNAVARHASKSKEHQPMAPLDHEAADMLLQITGADARRTFVCDQCPRRFLRAYDLKRHGEAIHAETEPPVKKIRLMEGGIVAGLCSGVPQLFKTLK
jgi:uncharacterized Zn-finger protein